MDAANGQKPLAGQPNSSGGVTMDKAKEWQMELLMEKLRSKASSFKSLVETAKNLRMAMLDKRFAIDSVEKNQLQKCLDTLQHSIKVTSLQSMVERLESLTRQLGLKFMMSQLSPVPQGTIQQGTELFISSDMFFLEVLLEPSGAVKDVKIHHEGKSEQQSCDVLVSCLSRGDFVDFTTQLEGLASIYQLNADKKVKCKAFSALQSLEADLGVLAQLQTFMKDPFNLVHKSPVGILERRRGGHAMKLTYFVSPYDLIDQENRTCDLLSPETIIKRKIGHSVTVCLEGSTAHKLPTSSIITVNRSPTGKSFSTPSYATLTSTNSSMLPACFVLKLAKKMPMCMELMRRIQKVTELECSDVSASHPLLSLIVQHASDGQLDCRNNRGLYVTLPDQQHCYFMTENRSMDGVLVGSIPFTHPAHVPQILVYLRQQALFNTLISSCVRPMARQDPEHTTIFEVSALSWQHISVSLEHPYEETMATAELDLTDISALKCKLYGVSIGNNEQTSDLTGKVLQRCLSIPLTMRTLMKAWEGRNSIPVNVLNSGNGNYNLNLGSGKDQNGQNGTGMPDFTNGETKIKQEPGLNNGNGSIGRQQSCQQQQQQQQSFLDAGTENSIGFPSYSGQSDTSTAAMLNPLQLGALLGQAKNSLSNQMSERTKKSRKRKTAEGLWRSPKRKGDETGEILLESSSSDSTPLGTPTGGRENLNETRTSTPTSAASLASGLDFSNLDPTDILGTDKSSDYDLDNESEIMEVHDLQDVEELIKRDRKSKKKEEKKSPNIFEENKNLVPPSVSITPISSSSLGQTTNYNSVLTGMGLERRPGIEIIPITSSPQTSLPSSITITPIAGPTTAKNISEERRERKSSKSKSTDDKGKLEKRRKRKREDSPMGPPPDKLPPKQDPLSKPVSVSIKPTESPPSMGSRPSSPATTLRKFSPSPTHTSPLALVGKSSPTLKQSTNKQPVQSPKHSPVYSSSPKHQPVPASVSPKHGTSSPKHGSSTSTGKPSMSALKSAANSPSSKNSDSSASKIKSSSSSSGKDSNRDKERKTSSLAFGGSSSGHQSPKTKSSSGKLKQLELIPSGEAAQASLPSSGGSTPPSGGSDLGKSAMAQQQAARNRKGSLSAVIDKLKNAQHCTDDSGNGGSKPASGGSGGSSGQKDRSVGGPSNKIIEGKCIGKNSSLDTKNPAEYMVKHSSDGMKITINKTRTKDSKSGTNLKLSSSTVAVTGTSSASSASSASLSGNGSPKTHTGLKPGVNSGPASKKPQSQTSPKLSGSSSTSSSSGSGKASLLGQKVLSALKSISGPNSGGNGSGGGVSGNVSGGSLLTKGASSSKSSGSPKTTSSSAADLIRNREKPRVPKSSDKNIFGSKGITDARKSSPSALREETDSERAFKLLAAHASMSSLPPQLVVEGLMKQLDTKFQIPKLSARANADGDKKSSDKLSLLPDSSKSMDNLSTKQTSEQGKMQLSSSSISSMSSMPKITSEEQSNQRRDHLQKPDNLSITTSGTTINPMNIGTDTSSGLMLPPPTSSSSHDSDIPTNLSMQSIDSDSRDVSKDTPASRSSSQFLGSNLSSSGSSKDDSGNSGVVLTVLPKGPEALASKPVYPMIAGSSTSGNSSTNVPTSGNGSLESLNLSTKPADAALGKYSKSVEEKKQQQQQQQTQVSSSVSTSASTSLGIVPVDAVSNVPKSSVGEMTGTSSQEAAEMLLDFSTPKDVTKSLNLTTIPERAMTQAAPVRRNTPPPPPPPPAFPPSPSVSVHIVKSPAPSPRVIPPSPHSASPCITDDELMDEALVGMGK